MTVNIFVVFFDVPKLSEVASRGISRHWGMLSLCYQVAGLARKLLGNRVGSMRRMSTIVELREEVRNRSNAPQGDSACRVRLCRVTFSCGHHTIHRGPIMSFNHQARSYARVACHASAQRRISRDGHTDAERQRSMTGPMVVVNVHHRRWARSLDARSAPRSFGPYGWPRELRSQETVMFCKLTRFSCRKLPTRKEDVCRVWQATIVWTGHRL